MSIQPAWQQTFAFFGLPVVVEPSRAALSADAGLLPIRQFDEQITLTRAFAAALSACVAPSSTSSSPPSRHRRGD